METIKNLYSELEWEQADNYPEGTLKKTLRDEEGAKTILLKLPPGFRMELHSHVTTEQDFVLEGSYINDNIRYPQGSYKIYKSHEEHGPFYSEEGAVVLVVWDPYQKVV